MYSFSWNPNKQLWILKWFFSNFYCLYLYFFFLKKFGNNKQFTGFFIWQFKKFEICVHITFYFLLHIYIIIFLRPYSLVYQTKLHHFSWMYGNIYFFSRSYTSNGTAMAKFSSSTVSSLYSKLQLWCDACHYDCRGDNT